jgi:hypothetical protein
MGVWFPRGNIMYGGQLCAFVFSVQADRLAVNATMGKRKQIREKQSFSSLFISSRAL